MYGNLQVVCKHIIKLEYVENLKKISADFATKNVTLNKICKFFTITIFADWSADQTM